MKVFNSILGLVLAWVLVGSWGCSKAKPQKDDEQVRAEQAQAEQARIAQIRADFENVMMDSDRLQQGDKPDEAITLLEGALANKDFSEFQTEIFQRLLYVDLMSENLAAAQARYSDMRKKNPLLARPCLGMIENYLFEQKEYEPLAQWLESLLVNEADEGALTTLARWQFRVARAQESANAAVAVLTPLKSRMQPAAWRGLAGEFGSALIQGNVADQADQLIAFLGTQEASDPEIGSLRISLQLSLWVARQEWDPAVNFVKNLSTKTEDAPLNGYFNQVADPLRRARQNEKLVALCRWALQELKGKPTTRTAAAQMYVRNAVELDDVGQALDRINELKTAGFDASHVARWLDMAYSISMKKGENKDFETLLTLGEEILPNVKDPREQANMAGIILDASFRLDRFETALSVLEKGVSGQDPAWHASMINKVKAHIDVQQGRPLDAAQKFIVFLNESASKMEPTIDPITDDLITREMVQGLNAKRIADLYKQGGKDAEAAVYYLKARDFYAQALKTIEPNSARAKKIEAELATLPE